jgi:hypothetical protein
MIDWDDAGNSRKYDDPTGFNCNGFAIRGSSFQGTDRLKSPFCLFSP